MDVTAKYELIGLMAYPTVKQYRMEYLFRQRR